MAHLGAQLNRASGEVGLSARHIENLNQRDRESLVGGMRGVVREDPFLVNKVTEYSTSGVIPVYMGYTAPTPRVGGPPYNTVEDWVLNQNCGMMLGMAGSCCVARKPLRNMNK